MDQQELPLGFGMALAQHPDAMARFAAMSEAEQKAFVDGVYAVQSKREMQAYIEQLIQ